MSDLWGPLGQQLPAATTLTDAYTVPSGKHATIKVIICNRGAAAVVRLAHAVGGIADASKQYLLYDFPVDVGETKVTDPFITAAGDVIRVYSDTGNVAFHVNGLEESN